MRVLLLGVGMQGKAALDDLYRSGIVEAVTAADLDLSGLRDWAARQGYGHKVRLEAVDAADPDSFRPLFAPRPDVLIDLLPSRFVGLAAPLAIEYGTHVVTTSYVSPALRDLSARAGNAGLAILPEFGMDPGIDLVLLGEAARSLDRVTEIRSYGGGIPAWSSAGNPIRYKISWTFEGVLKAYRRAGRILEEGREIVVEADALFEPAHLHEIEVEGVGRLEAIPNGDALDYARQLELPLGQLRTVGRYTLRWPGHSAFWRKLVALGLLDDAPVHLDGVAIDRKRYLAAALAPILQYGPREQDLSILRIEVAGETDGQPRRLTYQVIDQRDLATGFTAMSRTVGYTASIGAQLLGTGQITRRGLLSPLHDVPYPVFVEELARRNIQVTMTADGE